MIRSTRAQLKNDTVILWISIKFASLYSKTLITKTKATGVGSFVSQNLVYILSIALISGALAVYMYSWNSKSMRLELPRSIRDIVLLCMRWLSLFLIGLLLLNPYIKLNTQHSIKPKLAIMLDVSQSIRLARGVDTTQILRATEQLKQQLGGLYDVLLYPFSGGIHRSDSVQFTGSSTDIDRSLSELDDKHIEDNLTEVILISDGNYNQGNSPVYHQFRNMLSLHGVLIGDTTPFFDYQVSYVDYSPLSYLDEINKIQVQISAERALGTQAQLSLYQYSGGSRILRAQKPISPKSNSYQESLTLETTLMSEGVHRFRIEISCNNQEVNCVNNAQDITIEVVNGKKKILLMADAPHPDLSAIKQSLQIQKNLDITIAYPDRTPIKVEDYDLVWFHNLPSAAYNISQMLSTLQARQISVCFTVGSRTDLQALNQLQQSVRISDQAGFGQDILAEHNPRFTHFMLTPYCSGQIKRMPPLQARFLSIHSIRELQTLLYQKIGNVTTQTPMAMIGYQNQQMIGLWIGENIWRWRLLEYQQTKKYDAYDELISKWVNLLAIKRNKKRFRVQMAKSVYSENEPISADAVVYNTSYQPVTSSNVKMTLIGPNGSPKSIEMYVDGDKYSTQIGALPQGNYSYTAETILDGQRMQEQGSFVVLPFVLENQYSAANYTDMLSICAQNQGELYRLSNLESLIQKLKNKNHKNLLINENKTQSINDIWWVMALILTLLCSEWILRKYWSKE